MINHQRPTGLKALSLEIKDNYLLKFGYLNQLFHTYLTLTYKRNKIKFKFVIKFTLFSHLFCEDCHLLDNFVLSVQYFGQANYFITLT